jgi:AcrR family transcriptional regulator
MRVELEKISDRKPRADSLRNREHLLATAKTAFAEAGADVALEEIARRAGVGIGTLYRHFPTRDAILAAVYQREVNQLSASAQTLLETMPPGQALEAWLYLLIDYMATKRVIAPALRASTGEGSNVYASSGTAIIDAMNGLARAAVASGDIRSDIGPDDLYRMMIGVSHGYDRPDWEPSARRLVDILMTGLKPTR